MLILRVALAASLFHVCCALMSWAELASQYADPFVAQRDISTSNSIDQLTFLGVSLNKVVFDLEGYANTSLPTLQNLLETKYSLFMVDMYWNHFTQKWQLCPAPIPANDTGVLSDTVEVFWNNASYNCSPGFTVTDMFQYVETYLTSTNVRVKANVMQFAFNLKSLYYEQESPPAPRYNATNAANATNSTNTRNTTVSSTVPPEYTSYGQDYLGLGNSTLTDSLHAINSYLFSPSDLQQYDTSLSGGSNTVQYPSQDTYLFSLYKRVFPFVLSNSLHNSSSGYNISASDLNTIFFPGHGNFSPWVETLESTLGQNISNTLDGANDMFRDWAQNTHFRIVVDDETTAFNNDTVSKYLQSGFSAILNSSNYSTHPEEDTLYIANSYTPVSFWSWAPGQFFEDSSWNETDSHGKTYANNDEWYVTSNSQTAYSCVSVAKDGWELQNCYDKIRGACQNNSDPFSWELTSDIGTYLDWTNESSCPVGFSVGVPHSSLEQFSLLSHLVSRNVSYPVWIDLNDITVPGCYVSGGPYALCPYQEAVTTRNFFKGLAPSASVAIFLIILIFCERLFLKTPIHTNRQRHWKRRIADYYKENDYEGVPL